MAPDGSARRTRPRPAASIPTGHSASAAVLFSKVLRSARSVISASKNPITRTALSASASSADSRRNRPFMN
jgi:hypothetical protein